MVAEIPTLAEKIVAQVIRMQELSQKYDLQEIIAASNASVLIDPKDLETIGLAVVTEFNIDDRSREEWKGRYEGALQLALQIVEQKTEPWPGCANIKFPLVTIAATQFQSRAYPALINNPDLVKCTAIGDDPQGLKDAHADRVSQFMSYQLLDEDEEWEEDTDRMFFVLPIVGSTIRKTWFDPLTGHNKSQMILPDDFVVSYFTKNLEQCPRATHVLHKSKREIKNAMVAKFYELVELGSSTPSINYDNPSASVLEERGYERPTDDPDTERDILEQHRFLDLDQDGYSEPYIVTVDKDSKKVLRLSARFTQMDIKRDNQTQIQALMSQLKQLQTIQPPPDPVQKQIQEGIISDQVRAYETEIKRLTAEGQIINIDPVQYFTKYTFLPAPDGGFYDLGLGVILSPINDSVNTLINQLLDAGTMSVASTGFIAGSARIRGADLRFRPFEWKRADVAAGGLKDALVPLPVKEPSPVLFQLLNLLINYGERISSVTDLMVGETPGQNTPAQTSQSALDQGMKVFSGILKRLHRSMKKEFRKLYRLNRYYLDPQQYFQVLGTNQMQQIYQEDFMGNPNEVVPESDPTVASDQQRIQRALAIAQRSTQVQGYDPKAVEEMVLKAMRIPDAQALFPPLPPQPDPEIQIKAADQARKALESQYDTITKLAETQARVENLRAQATLFLAQAQQAGMQMNDLKIQQHLAAFDSIHGALDAMQSQLSNQQELKIKQDQLAQQKQEAQQNANSQGQPNGQ